MNPSLWQVLIWKEVRQLRAIWLAFAIFGGLFLIYLNESYFPGSSDAHTQMLYAVTFMAPLFSVAACAALFAGEAEAGTDRWLLGRGLPVGSYLGAKLILILGAGLVLAGLLVAGVVILRGWPPVYASIPLISLFSPAILGLCGLAHAYFWSTRIRQTLPAAALSVLSFLIVVPFLDNAMYRNPFISLPGYRQEFDWLRNDLFRQTTIACLHWGPLAAWMLRAWQLGIDSVDMTGGRSKAHPLGPLAYAAPPSSSWAALAWKEWSRLKYPVAGLLVVTSLILLDLWLNPTNEQPPLTLRIIGSLGKFFTYHENNFRTLFVVPFLMIASVVALLAGVLTFMDDRTARGYRFLHHRGLSPTKLWLTKISIWSICPVLITACSLFILQCPYVELVSQQFAQRPILHAWTDQRLIQTIFVLTNSLLLYTIGIRCSLLFRAPILALAVASLTGIVAFFFRMFVIDLFPGPTLILAIGTAMLLLGTWQRTKDWLAENAGGWPNLWATNSILAPFLFTYVGISIYRMTEPGPAIPDAARPTLPPLTATQQRTTEEFSAILAAIDRPWDDKDDLPKKVRDEAKRQARIDFAKRNRPHLDRLLAAIQLEPSDFPRRVQEGKYSQYSLLSSDIARVHAWLQGEIAIAIDEKDTIRSRDRLIAWARFSDHLAYRGSNEYVDGLEKGFDGLFSRDVLDWIKATRPSPPVVKDLIDVLKKRAAVDIDQLRRWSLVNADGYRRSTIQNSGINAWDDFMTSRILYYAGLWIADTCERERSLRAIDQISLIEFHTFAKSSSKTFTEPADLALYHLHSAEKPFLRLLGYSQYSYWEKKTPLDRISDRRFFLLDVARVLWKNEFGEEAKYTGDAALRYLGGIPVSVMNGQPMAVTTPAPP